MESTTSASTVEEQEKTLDHVNDADATQEDVLRRFKLRKAPKTNRLREVVHPALFTSADDVLHYFSQKSLNKPQYFRAFEMDNTNMFGGFRLEDLWEFLEVFFPTISAFKHLHSHMESRLVAGEDVAEALGTMEYRTWLRVNFPPGFTGDPSGNPMIYRVFRNLRPFLHRTACVRPSSQTTPWRLLVRGGWAANPEQASDIAACQMISIFVEAIVRPGIYGEVERLKWVRFATVCTFGVQPEHALQVEWRCWWDSHNREHDSGSETKEDPLIAQCHYSLPVVAVMKDSVHFPDPGNAIVSLSDVDYWMERVEPSESAIRQLISVLIGRSIPATLGVVSWDAAGSGSLKVTISSELHEPLGKMGSLFVKQFQEHAAEASGGGAKDLVVTIPPIVPGEAQDPLNKPAFYSRALLTLRVTLCVTPGAQVSEAIAAVLRGEPSQEVARVLYDRCPPVPNEAALFTAAKRHDEAHTTAIAKEREDDQRQAARDSEAAEHGGKAHHPPASTSSTKTSPADDEADTAGDNKPKTVRWSPPPPNRSHPPDNRMPDGLNSALQPSNRQVTDGSRRTRSPDRMIVRGGGSEWQQGWGASRRIMVMPDGGHGHSHIADRTRVGGSPDREESRRMYRSSLSPPPHRRGRWSPRRDVCYGNSSPRDGHREPPLYREPPRVMRDQWDSSILHYEAHDRRPVLPTPPHELRMDYDHQGGNPGFLLDKRRDPTSSLIGERSAPRDFRDARAAMYQGSPNARYDSYGPSMAATSALRRGSPHRRLPPVAGIRPDSRSYSPIREGVQSSRRRSPPSYRHPREPPLAGASPGIVKPRYGSPKGGPVDRQEAVGPGIHRGPAPYGAAVESRRADPVSSGSSMTRYSEPYDCPPAVSQKGPPRPLSSHEMGLHPGRERSRTPPGMRGDYSSAERQPPLVRRSPPRDGYASPPTVQGRRYSPPNPPPRAIPESPARRPFLRSSGVVHSSRLRGSAIQEGRHQEGDSGSLTPGTQANATQLGASRLDNPSGHPSGESPLMQSRHPRGEPPVEAPRTSSGSREWDGPQSAHQQRQEVMHASQPGRQRMPDHRHEPHLQHQGSGRGEQSQQSFNSPAVTSNGAASVVPHRPMQRPLPPAISGQKDDAGASEARHRGKPPTPLMTPPPPIVGRPPPPPAGPIRGGLSGNTPPPPPGAPPASALSAVPPPPVPVPSQPPPGNRQHEQEFLMMQQAEKVAVQVSSSDILRMVEEIIYSLHMAPAVIDPVRYQDEAARRQTCQLVWQERDSPPDNVVASCLLEVPMLDLAKLVVCNMQSSDWRIPNTLNRLLRINPCSTPQATSEAARRDVVSGLPSHFLSLFHYLVKTMMLHNKPSTSDPYADFSKKEHDFMLAMVLRLLCDLRMPECLKNLWRQRSNQHPQVQEKFVKATLEIESWS